MTGCFTREAASQVLDAWDRLSYKTKQMLTQELNISGCDGKKGILIYHSSDLLMNILTKQEMPLKEGLELLATLYEKTRNEIFFPASQNGVFPLNILKLADAAAKGALHNITMGSTSLWSVIWAILHHSLRE
jgi:hypothetical protein